MKPIEVLGKFSAEMLKKCPPKIQSQLLNQGWLTILKSGTVAYKKGDFTFAEEMFSKAVSCAEKFGPDDPRLGTSLNWLATTYLAQEKFNAAEPLCKRAIAIWEKAMDESQDKVDDKSYRILGAFINNLAAVRAKQGQTNDATELYERALAVFDKCTESGDSDHITCIVNLANWYTKLGNYDRARELHERALALRQSVFGPEDVNVALSLEGLAIMYQKQGRSSEAEPLYQRALNIREKHLGTNDPSVLRTREMLDLLHKMQSVDLPEADSNFEKALAGAEKKFGPNHSEVADILEKYARFLQLTHREAEATKFADRAKAIRSSQR